MTAILFGIDKALEWFFPQYRTRLNERFPQETRRRFFWSVVTAFVFLSGFLAWKDEREKLASLQKRISEQARASQKSPSAHVKVTKEGTLSVSYNLSAYGLTVKKIEFQGDPAYTLTFNKEPEYIEIHPEAAAEVERVKLGPNTYRVRFVGYDLSDPIIESAFFVMMSPLNM